MLKSCIAYGPAISFVKLSLVPFQLLVESRAAQREPEHGPSIAKLCELFRKVELSVFMLFRCYILHTSYHCRNKNANCSPFKAHMR